MAFWSGEHWRESGNWQPPPVCPWEVERIEAAGYRLSIGREVFLSGEGKNSVEVLEEGQNFVVAPGQFAYLLTEESVSVPLDVIGFISIRASTKFQGLVNVSGFQVNPGFNGCLIFAVFNAGPRYIHLRRGDEIFALWFAGLSSAATAQEDGGRIPNRISKIPSSVLSGIAGDALTAYQVNKKVETLTEDVKAVTQTQFRINVIAGIVLLFVAVLLRSEIVELAQLIFREDAQIEQLEDGP